MSGTPPAAGPRGASATDWTRGLRLACGLILLTYVVTHLANHSLGLVSLDAMEASRRWFLALWRSPVGTVALYGAVLTHVTLALWALFVRRHLRIPAWELVDGREVPVPAGYTLLEVSRATGIPHASVCGGRGRCSTCRVRVGQGLDALPPPSPEELRVLRQIGATPNVRLACQVRPVTDVAVTPLLPATVGPAAALSPVPDAGREQEVTVLFADLRGFTTLASGSYPTTSSSF